MSERGTWASPVALRDGGATLGVIDTTDKQPSRKGTPKKTDSRPGMMGDGTEEQNLDQPGKPDARIKQDEVDEAFGEKKPKK